MANNIDNATVRQFSDEIIMLAQQEESRLLTTVKRKSITGDRSYFDRLGPVDVFKKTGRAQPVVHQDPDHSRRIVKIEDFVGALLLDKQDELRMLIDPKSDYAKSIAMGMARQWDKIIISAATGLAEASTTSDLTESTVALPAGNIVDEDFGAADTNLTVEKLREAKKRLDENEVGSSERRYCIVNASALDNLLADTTVTSSDFNTVKALVQGELNTFLGFDFVRTELLEDQSEGFKQILCYTQSAIGMVMADEMSVRIDEIPTLHHATQILAASTFGAVRIEEEKLIVIECVQA